MKRILVAAAIAAISYPALADSPLNIERDYDYFGFKPYSTYLTKRGFECPEVKKVIIMQMTYDPEEMTVEKVYCGSYNSDEIDETMGPYRIEQNYTRDRVRASVWED